MDKLDKLDYWSMDSIQIPDEYHLTTVPDLTRDNIKILVDEHNKLVDVVNELVDLFNPEQSPVTGSFTEAEDLIAHLKSLQSPERRNTREDDDNE